MTKIVPVILAAGARTRLWPVSQDALPKQFLPLVGERSTGRQHWVVVRGTAEVTIGTEVKSVHQNESIYNPIGAVHRLANRGNIPLELIEVQTGSYLGEDDIERLDDVYKRD
jgi:mannose-6-phosphate isomerase-like protein (cupin superfamily)